eukprot:364041-Chlamydomonas_euryale.AAC.1
MGCGEGEGTEPWSIRQGLLCDQQMGCGDGEGTEPLSIRQGLPMLCAPMVGRWSAYVGVCCVEGEGEGRAEA